MMYLRGAHRYYKGGDQCVGRAPFLLLLQLRDGPCDASNTYACVRQVALQQLGHFMMGRVNLCGKWHTVSGTYGSDGLPMSVDKIPADAKPLPRELYDAWNKGGGWNSAGSEAPLMRDWALTELRMP
jgi:hypothetical protein